MRRNLPMTVTRRGILRIAAGAGAAATGFISHSAVAALRLDIPQGNIQPIPIALPDFIGGGPGDADAARSVTQVITNNLARSGLFAQIDPAAYIEKIASFEVQ